MKSPFFLIVMKVALFFGSFNPVHNGHLIIANYIVEHTTVDQLWMVVSPHNPLKKRATLANDYDRLHLVNIATEQHDKIFSCDIEFNLPKPSYTIDTLVYLKEKYPDHEFELVGNKMITKSLPPKRGIFLYHNGNGDHCREHVTEELQFDITVFAYLDQEIVIRLQGWEPYISYTLVK